MNAAKFALDYACISCKRSGVHEKLSFYVFIICIWTLFRRHFWVSICQFSLTFTIRTFLFYCDFKKSSSNRTRLFVFVLAQFSHFFDLCHIACTRSGLHEGRLLYVLICIHELFFIGTIEFSQLPIFIHSHYNKLTPFFFCDFRKSSSNRTQFFF